MTTEAKTLNPDSSGNVYISTAAGLRGIVASDWLGVEAPFTCPPTIDGYRADGVRITTDGALEWIVGNIGNIPVVELAPGAYNAVGWSLVVTYDGSLEVTNASTGRTVAVSLYSVEAR
ncbi:hypothetical protein ACWDTP_34060 [Mycobacterium sp. NPDC003449]